MAFDPTDEDGPGPPANPYPRLVAPRKRGKRWEYDELAAASDIPEPESFWGPAFCRQTLTLIAGRRGCGKTYFTLALAAAVANGRPFGHLPTRAGKVMFFSEEMGESAMRHRILRSLTLSEMKRVRGKLLIVFRNFTAGPQDEFEAIDLTSRKGPAEFASQLSEEKPDLVIIDALRDIKRGLKESDNDEMGRFLVGLRDQVATPLNCCIALLHHMGKPGADGVERGGRGASAIEDVCADVIYLRANGALRSGHFEKTRDGALEDRDFSFTIEENPETNTLDLAISTAADTPESLEARKLYDAIVKDGPKSTLEIMEQFLWSKRKVGRIVKIALEVGLLHRLSPIGSPGLYGLRPPTLTD